MFVEAVNIRKIGPNSFFTGSTAFILKNFGSIDFFGPNELIFLLAQEVSKNRLDSYNMFPDVSLVR